VLMFVDNPQLLFTLDQLPTYGKGRFRYPRKVKGAVMLDTDLYVVYEEYNKVQVFNCEDHCKKIKNIEVKEMKSPSDMVGSSVTSQLFISELSSDVIWRVDSKTGVSDVFNKTGYKDRRSLSLVLNHLLVTSGDALLMFDIVSGERIKEIPLAEDITRYDVRHAIESNRDSFFVIHGLSSDNSTVSEIDSEGRVIRVFDNKQKLACGHLALNSVGRLLVSDWWKNSQVVLFDEHLKYERILIDNKRLDARPMRLNYNKNNNRLMVGLRNGHVKIFEY
jgi:hypothetical protein